MNPRKRKRLADGHLKSIHSKHPRGVMNDGDGGIYGQWKTLGLDLANLAYETVCTIPESLFSLRREPVATSELPTTVSSPEPDHPQFDDASSKQPQPIFSRGIPPPVVSSTTPDDTEDTIPPRLRDKARRSQQPLRTPSSATSFRKSPKNKTKASSSSNWPAPSKLQGKVSSTSSPRPPQRNAPFSSSLGSLGSYLDDLALDSHSDATSSTNPNPSRFPANYAPSPTLDARLAENPPMVTKPRHPPRRRKTRPHIFKDVHDAQVRATHKQMKQDLRLKLFVVKKKKGYSLDFKDFIGLLKYEQFLEDKVEPSQRPSSPPKDDITWLKNKVAKITATLSEPKPQQPQTPQFSKIVRARRAKDEAIEMRLRPPRPSLPSSLPPEDEAKVASLLSKRGVISKFSREQVTDQDIYRLKPGQWLNDEIINFYGAMLMARSDAYKENSAKTSDGKPLKAFYMSTFFWSKLTKEGYEKGRLAKWTKKVDVFSKDVILIPVNHSNAHWTAAAINFRRKRFESYDSMGIAKDQVFKYLRLYVDAEHQNKKKTPFCFKEWDDWAPDELTPQQENGVDCGVFTCQFLESLSRGEEEFNFTQRDMPYLRKRMVLEIGNASLYGDL